MPTSSEATPPGAQPQIRLWGVRGSVPTPEENHLEHGGNTPCVELRTSGSDVLIIDGGTGIRPLGSALDDEFGGGGATVHVLLSHFHWDHLQGIPYFAPLFDERTEIVFYANANSDRIEAALDSQMQAPFFPIGLDQTAAQRRFVSLPASGMKIGEAQVTPVSLTHPQGASGFRIDVGDGSLLYASDHEHGDAIVDGAIREAATGTDLLIYDAQYTPEEYATRIGWGHSTWESGIEIAGAAGTGKLLLFHHDPAHNDDELVAIEEQARKRLPCTSMAREGDTYILGEAESDWGSQDQADASLCHRRQRIRGAGATKRRRNRPRCGVPTRHRELRGIAPSRPPVARQRPVDHHGLGQYQWHGRER